MISLATSNLIQLIIELAKNMTPVVYRRGQVLFYEGHMPCGLFVIKEGRVRLGNNSTDDDLDASVVGLRNLINKTPYDSSCTASSTVKAVFLPKTVIEDAVQKPQSNT